MEDGKRHYNHKENNDDSNDSSSEDSSDDEDDYEDYDWEELPTNVREAALILRYTETLWNNDEESSTADKDWWELSPIEQNAAKLLKFTAEIWNNNGSLPNLILVQIYVETNDYLLKDVETVGLSMFVNRNLGKDEIIIREAVGPRELNEKIAMGPVSKSSDMLPERRAFMERFMVWQKKYKTSSLVGSTTCDWPQFTNEHFNHRGNEAIEDFPTCSSRNQSYFYEMKQRDYVIVEFIPRNDKDNESAATVPESRLFEVLGYDEAIPWQGEDRYDPSVLCRPPTLPRRTSRSLEVPLHFSNHACGQSATVYDTYRLATDGDCTDSALVAPAQSAEFNNELKEWTASGVEPSANSLLVECENDATTYRAMKKGNEILTDYALWHWSNEVYVCEKDHHVPYKNYQWKDLPWNVQNAATILGLTKNMWDNKDTITSASYNLFKKLSPDEQEAAKFLGYTSKQWDNIQEELTPWFCCLCNDVACHSKDGFLGVKCFSLVEQKRSYWLYSKYIQQQIDWKVFQE